MVIMRKVDNYSRVNRLINEAVSHMKLNLVGINVLTEAASGPFVVTPLIAAMAGADRVFAICRDSRYGSVKEVADYLQELCDFLQLGKGAIEFVTGDYLKYVPQANIVTNLGFVRPITAEVINVLPDDAAIPLMWEAWELREEDIDFKACKRRGIPILGTRETEANLEIFRYVGLLPLKLLFENNIEVFKSNILVLSSGAFGDEICRALKANGAQVVYIDSSVGNTAETSLDAGFLAKLDAVVIAEHRNRQMILGGQGLITPAKLESKPLIVHICGAVEYDELDRLKLAKVPSRRVDLGYMTVTTDYVGPKPVIDLHAAGLKVGEALVKGMRLYGDYQQAIEYALKNSPGMPLK